MYFNRLRLATARLNLLDFFNFLKILFRFGPNPLVDSDKDEYSDEENNDYDLNGKFETYLEFGNRGCNF